MVVVKSMKKDDKVHLKGREEVTGVIEKSRTNNLWGIDYIQYYVKYDKDDLIPPADWHDEIDLVLIESLPMGGATRLMCECGVSKVMPNGKHSSYCPLYKG